MEKEIIRERKCLNCSKILPKKSRSDKKTCSAYCRKKYSQCIATVGNTEYKRSEVSKEAKELFDEWEEMKQRIEHIQWLILVTDTTENTLIEDYKALFKNYTIDSIKRLKESIETSEENILNINISQVQDILDELDDRDNERNDNLFN